MRRLCSAAGLAAALAVAGATPAVAASSHRATAAMPAAGGGLTGRLLVTLDDHAATAAGTRARAAATERLVAEGAKVAATVPQIGLVTVAPTNAGASLASLADRLRGRSGIASVQPERRFSPRAVPNDPALSQLEATPGTAPNTPVEWWALRENLPAAWDISHGAGATVAVIDTGLDGTHPEFAGRITQAINLDPTSSSATTDTGGHGTHVASLACATANDGISIAGAGFGCGLLVIKSDLSDTSVAQGIVEAANAGAQSINMSFGTDGRVAPPAALVDAINYAYGKDVVMVAAAADSPVQEQGDPANILQPAGTGPNITQGKGLDVTAANFNDTRASFAGLGSEISMAAYGAYEGSGDGGPPGLLGAFPGNRTQLEASPLTGGEGCGCRTTFNGDSRYAYLQGSSMSAPQVSAVAAMMRALNPDLHAATVIQALKQTARRGGGYTQDVGWGILDAGKALAFAKAFDGRAPVATVKYSPSTIKAPARGASSRTVTLRVSDKDAGPAGVTPSGVSKTSIYRRKGKGKYTRIATTTKTKLRVHLQRGGDYAFYAIGVDKAGNRGAVPAKPTARIRVRSR